MCAYSNHTGRQGVGVTPAGGTELVLTGQTDSGLEEEARLGSRAGDS